MADGVTSAAAVPATTAAPDSSKMTLEQYQARLQEAFTRALTVEDLVAITRKLVEQARDGDKTAARLVLKYSLGNFMPAARKHPEKEARLAAIPAALPSPDDTMALIHRRLAEQSALEAEIRGQRPSQAGPGKAAR